jgi:hypothetical protein
MIIARFLLPRRINVQALYLYPVRTVELGSARNIWSSTATSATLRDQPGPAFRQELRLSICTADKEINNETFWFSAFEQHYIEVQNHDDTSQLRVQEVAINQVNYTAIKEMLSICRTYHKRCATKQLEKIPGFKLMDCEQRKIVAINDLDLSVLEYLTLSYVWGQASAKEVEVDEYGFPILPRTIEDALSATKALGYRYLWVDRYCIDQKRVNEKMAQINAMANIYESCQATLIAAAGSGPKMGLPGVSKARLSSQLQASIGNKRFISTMRPPDRLVKSSIWNSRGWTFQEGLLSRRRVVFTEEQVFYQCRETQICESLYHPRTIEGRLGCPFPGAAFPELLAREHWEDEYITFPHLVSIYSRRNLSFESDILSAFNGILKMFETSTYQIYCAWGIPILLNSSSPDSETIAEKQTRLMKSFANGLRWQSGPAKRRHGFPSWSWTGWKCGVPDVPGWLSNGEWKVPCDNLSPEAHLHKHDDCVLSWESIINGLKDGVLDERNLSHALTLDCWTLPFTVVKNWFQQKAARFQIGDKVYLRKIQFMVSHLDTRRSKLLGICIPDQPDEISTVLVVSQRQGGKWERVGEFHPLISPYLFKCTHDPVHEYAEPQLCDRFPLSRQRIVIV